MARCLFLQSSPRDDDSSAKRKIGENGCALSTAKMPFFVVFYVGFSCLYLKVVFSIGCD